MAAVREIEAFLFSRAPKELAADWDNVGLLAGFPDREVTRLLVALDITQEVVREAAELGAELIVAHHPVMNCAWAPVQTIRDDTVQGKILTEMITNGISGICMHTNLDAAPGGVNDCLAQALGLEQIGQLHQDGVLPDGAPYGIGRVGSVHQSGLSAAEYAAFVKERLGSASVRFTDGGRHVRRVAVGGGACGSMFRDALAAGCDTFITADVKYDQFLEAQALGLAIMDAGHFATENVVCRPLADALAERFPQVEALLSRAHREVYSAL